MPPLVTKTTAANRWSATATRVTQVHDVMNVLRVIMATPLSPVDGANLVVAVTTSTYQTLRHVTSALASVSSACTTLKDRTVACARADTMEMLPAATAGSARATSWARSAVSVCLEMIVCASVPQDSVSVFLTLLDKPVITVHPITGTWRVDEAVSPVDVTPTMPTHLPVTSSQDSASAVLGLEGRPVKTARRTTGVTQEYCAEHVTATPGASSHLSATV